MYVCMSVYMYTHTHTHTHTHVYMYGQRSLVGYTVHGGHKKSDMTEGLGLFFLYDICISYIYIYGLPW